MKQLKVTVNGKVYDIVIEEVGGASYAPKAAPAAAPAPAPVAAAPAPAPAAAAPAPAPSPAAAPVSGGTNITAPMSGTVTKHKVKAGDTVKNGDVIVILEAMKMENDLVSPVAGTVVQMLVNEGTPVKPGQIIAVIA